MSDTQAPVQRPFPLPTDLTRPYWEAAKQGELRIQHCKACDHWQFYPRPFCLNCESEDVQWQATSGLGSIYTFTVNHRAPNPFMKARLPYVVAIVQLDEGPRLMAHAVPGMRIGERVRAGFFEHQGRTLVRFAPVP